jgi:ribonuclease P protein component
MSTGKDANTLQKREIARGKKYISRLFMKGSRQKGNDLLMICTQADRDRADRGSSLRVMFTVGKKNVPKAVTRNRVKRLLREAYRQEKHDVLKIVERMHEDDGVVMLIAFLYKGKQDSIPSLSDFRTEIRQFLRSINGRQLRQAADGHAGK